ncbi:hypothetical protein DRF67_07880 [Chryseobacterium pennipullorum]|uniref:Lipoprotein n=2 Tax=Chryseobacterium pennipullorum TaxID=2258963 RepID=A0A3D9B4T8_9FLAO|nr:hypothetical protein DRF67_07880 [Chryseobacterium pennipullorum]
MKKMIVLFLIGLFTLQSCSVSSEITYHKDSSSTFVTDIDTREFMSEMQAMTPDSLKQKEFGEIDKLPTVWTSLYDLEKREGKIKTQHPDTVRIMKKIFMKSKQDDRKLVGLSFKMDHFTADDHQVLKNYNKREKLPLDQNIYNAWDGKTLTIDTENFNLRNIEETLRSKSSKEGTEKIEGMMMMFFKEIGTTLKFDHKIRTITGKHDWLKQTDEYSVKIDYDLKTLYDKEAKLKNADKKIVITTE